MFKETYAREGTEDRVLVYRGPRDLAVVRPEAVGGVTHVECDLPLALDVGGVLYDLVADLHSHHVLGACWSETDDAAERIRGVVFGVFSWAGGQDRWLFRRFTGQGFEALSCGVVVADD